MPAMMPTRINPRQTTIATGCSRNAPLMPFGPSAAVGSDAGCFVGSLPSVFLVSGFGCGCSDLTSASSWETFLGAFPDAISDDLPICKTSLGTRLGDSRSIGSAELMLTGPSGSLSRVCCHIANRQDMDLFPLETGSCGDPTCRPLKAYPADAITI